ncbi:MAG: T9SS type A sorting domain-containing protein [Pedobacter sp.]|nr:T9SS type A sorting domain-containing protein [Chitinophagaceae bacterium]
MRISTCVKVFFSAKVLCAFLFILAASITTINAQTITWLGGANTDYFTKANWSDNTVDFANIASTTINVGAGSTYDCAHAGGNANTSYRPSKLNKFTAGTFTVAGILYPNNSDSINGNIILKPGADFNIRNIVYLGRNSTATVTMFGGNFTSKYAFNIAIGNSGSNATVTINGGSIFAGTDLNLANGTGLTARINITGGTVNIPGNLNIGTGGSFFISGVGTLKMTGNKVTQLNGLIADGRLTCTVGKILVVTYDGTNTIAAIPQNPNSMITEYPDSVVLKTTNLVCSIEKNSGNILSYRYKGIETVANKPTDGHKYMYHDFTTSYGFETIFGGIYEIVQDSTDFAHIVIKRPYTPSAGHVTPVDCELHYALKKDDKAIYVYSKLEHKPNYPKFDIGSWRQVWWIASNNGVNLCERIYTDSLRSWQMPAPSDTYVGSNGPQEIIRMTSGVRAGKLDGKYEYSLKFWDNPLWGHASNINNIGSWCVNTSCEYYNEGPMYHDLNAAAGIIHQCMNGVHYGAGGIFADTLTSWNKIFGPYLLLITDKSTGDSNWIAAKQRQIQEKALWPYSWVKDTVAYPLANKRGTISGKFVVTDALKPTLTSANAWVGVTDLSDGVAGFQFEGKNYQYWIRADAAGNFTIPNIRPGTYSLFAFVDGVVGEYRLDNVTVTANATTTLGTLTKTVDRTNGNLVWEIGKPNRMADEFKMGDFDYCEGNIQFKYRDSFPNLIEYNVADKNWGKVLPYAHVRYPDTAAIPNIGDSWKWRLKFNLPAGFSTSGSARLTIAYASTDHAQQYIYVNNENSLFSYYYPDYGDGNAFLRQANYAKYSYKQVLIPMNKLVVGSNTITLVMPSGSGWVSHIMYDYISLEANVVVLPVTLIAFTAAPNSNGQVQLNWATASEVNSSYFDVEKSGDGISFSPISRITTTGTTTNGSNYSLIDNTPVVGTNCYRLKQVDIDGKFAYSEVRIVNINSSKGLVVYPNPAKDNITIHATSALKNIEIVDATGKHFFTQSGIASNQLKVSISNLPVGTYFIKVNDGANIAITKFNKQ